LIEALANHFWRLSIFYCLQNPDFPLHVLVGLTRAFIVDNDGDFITALSSFEQSRLTFEFRLLGSVGE
jgi:hypothetical protein